MTDIILKQGREKSVLRKHPWIFSGAIDRVLGSPKPGETVNVLSYSNNFLAKAAYNPKSNIAGRIWTWDKNEQVNAKFFEKQLKQALNARQKFAYLVNSNAIRQVHAESDGIPGLVLDRYNDIYVVQFLTAGVEYWKDVLVELIVETTHASVLYERSDVDVRTLEGLELKNGILFGPFSSNYVNIIENNIRFCVDIHNGHKTGFYLDQRDNRLKARSISNGLRVLDCFSYSGGFAINALAGGALAVTIVDSSADALALAGENISQNNLSIDHANLVEADVFKYLRYLRDKNDSYDLIILDPPKFAPTSEQVERASRAYKDINLLALKILAPGGYLMTYSCSGGVSEELFQKIIAGAALDAGVDAVILDRLHQGCDHPVAMNFPEGAYLKGFLIHKRN